MKRLVTIVGALAGLLAMTVPGVMAASFTGTPGNDRLVGSNSADIIRGFAGNDRLYGRNGNDRIIGDSGADLVVGQVGDDSLDGGLGNDTIVGGTESDRLFGQAGDDDLRSVGDAVVDFVNCGTGTDIAYVSGNDVVDGTEAGGLTSTLGLTCETLVVDGRRIPPVGTP